MDYEDYLTKADCRRLEKQQRCSHPKIRFTSMCRSCGKIKTVEVERIDEAVILIQEGFFNCPIYHKC